MNSDPFAYFVYLFSCFHNKIPSGMALHVHSASAGTPASVGFNSSVAAGSPLFPSLSGGQVCVYSFGHMLSLWCSLKRIM
jgi:hypothetical protein